MRTPSRILICAMGSHGDMLPFIGLGAVLQRRGHEVRFYGNGLFDRLVTRAGLHFVETSDADLVRAALADPRATETRGGLGLIGEGVVDTVLPTYRAMAADVLPGATLLLGSTLAFAPRLLAETHGLPCAIAHLSPSIFRSEHRAPRLLPQLRIDRWPRLAQRGLWALADWRVIDPVFTRPFNVARASLGLPPVQRMLHRWIHQASLNLGMFPGWFANPQPDWPAAELTGFPMYDGEPEADAETEAEADADADAEAEADADAGSASLRRFLDAGPAPVVFTAGTANTRSKAFYAESAAACVRLGLRGILVAAERAQLPDILPPELLHVSYARFKLLFPRAAAVVHHAGIGTLSQALGAGVPQLVRPMAYDQFDNAARACDLGVATELLPAHYRGERLDAALTGLLRDRQLHVRCAAVAQRMKSEDGLSRACDLIEALPASSQARPARA
ncbi:RhlB, TDP-rhamnosyltransferase 1 [Burkholderiales bacterium 8X]|nr:RhlB, TDP-rhamnosyltransferase 1 [Burkholderiales bacterium 8X]